MLIPSCILFSVLHRCLAVDITYYVKEGMSPGTLVGDIAADTHLMDNFLNPEQSQITFSQLEVRVTSISKLFRVSKKSGKLYTAQTLDAESLCKHNKECFRMVEVAVRRAKMFMKILEIKVIIQDINDHQPEFPNKIVEIQFEENDSKGTKKSTPSAIDRDVGLINSQITYRLKKNLDEPFTLFVSQNVGGSSDLSITLEDKLDREVKDSYVIQIIAKDKGSPPKQSVLDVHISVTDVNDNSPVFSQKIYNVSIRNEPSDTSPIAIVSAMDLDAGMNGRITYHFSFQTPDSDKIHFELNEITGQIFLNKKFTMAQDLKSELYIKAIDGGNPPLSSIAMVQVNIINQQNNPPNIDVNFVSASMDNTVDITEDIKLGSFIAYVKVTDHDAGQNGEVSCDLRHDKFQLHSLGPKKFKVTVKNPLNREVEDHYDVIISCHDKGTPPLYSKSKFYIQVLDVNDVHPRFTKETFKFWIYENEESKIHVGTINATDPDLGPGGKLTYSLLTNNKKFLPFQINNVGVITTVLSLDYEFQHVYRFQVFVRDSGIPSLNNTVNIIVEVRDKNDNAPYFTFPNINPFTLDVIYYPHHTKNITKIKASDSDSRENAFLKYEITGGNEKQLFAINHYTGLLVFTRVLTQRDAGLFKLEFTAKDSGNPVRSATTTVFLTLAVSNKTSDPSNSIHIRADDKVHLNSAVIIVLGAVTVSIIITASMSICILRYCYQMNVSQREETNPSPRFVSEQRHLISSSYYATSWPDVRVAVSTDPNATPRTAQRAVQNGEGSSSFKQAALTTSLKPRPSVESAHQMNIPKMAGALKAVKAPDNHSCRSTMSFHTDSGCCRHEGDIVLSDKVPVNRFTIEILKNNKSEGTDLRRELGNLRFYEDYKPPSCQTDHVKISQTKPKIQEIFSNPKGRTFAAVKHTCKPFHKQSSDHNERTVHTVRDSDCSTASLSSRNIIDASNSRPLPPVPHTSTSIKKKKKFCR